ncbi:hypothetical protein GR160_07890 [Flavobacterium sp. Sd200]|uniref:hypothetical protein n=1 Tax=Flavobacterium sp. Sd200 TaxID=2692211 RepID=UPI001368C48E|nr:hypothetical protein [Flavobacterium sp. Sd200]MXN91150.1 hypothetical protein [Flavobacterium sp. Sd200]
MAQVPFNPSGVIDKQTELYALTNPLLDAQADLIQTQFKDWVRDNFLLTPDQDEFLDLFTGDFLSYISGEVSDTVRARSPIVLSILNPGGPKSSKRLKSKRCKWQIFHQNGKVEFAEELTIEIIYDPA